MSDSSALAAENDRLRIRLAELEALLARDGAPDDRLRIILENVNVGVATADATGRLTSFNEAFRALLGYEAQALAQMHFADFTHPEDLLREKVYFEELLAGTRDRYHLEKRCVASDGRHVWVDLYVGATRSPEGSVERYVGVVADITARRTAEAHLRQRESLLSAVFAQMTEAVALLEVSPGSRMHVLTVNGSAVSLFAPPMGGGGAALAGRSLEAVLEDVVGLEPGRVARVLERIAALVESGEPTVFEHSLGTRTGPRLFESSLIPVRGPSGTVTHVLWTGRDITEARRQEEALRASLEEKETLMREIHHRVKNNFQLVSSLLSLQERADGDERLAEAFDRARARLRAMASVHERLYRSSSVSQLDFGAHLRELVAALASSRGASGVAVTCQADGAVTLDIAAAIPLGLISAELVTNALKHAYPAGAAGPVEVRLEATGQRVVLSVADRGAGLPRDFTPDTSRSLGVRLVESLARQLDADVTWARDGGTRVTVSMPRPARAA